MITRSYGLPSVLLVSLLLASACSSSSGAEDTGTTSGGADASSGAGTTSGDTGDTSGSGAGATDTGGEGAAQDTSGSTDTGTAASDGAGGELISDGQMTSSALDAGVADAAITIPGVTQQVPTFVTVEQGDGGTLQILCGTEPCQCSDGIDNDGDGVADGMDGECTGPFDNDEGTFSTGVPGDNRDPKWQDCFFDGNSGAGDDGCRYATDCLNPDVEVTNKSMCEVTQECVDFCQPLTPPGCDCFGCCEIPNGGDSVFVLVSETCSLEKLDDEQACPRCEQTDSCVNECGECELCVGKTIDDLPATCFSNPPSPPEGGSGSTEPPGGGGTGGTMGTGGSGTPGEPGGAGAGGAGGSSSQEPPPANVCDNGLQACVETADCGGNYFCSFGCCKPLVIFK